MRGIAMNEHVTPKRPATYEDVFDAPERMVADIVRGALHLHPRPAPRHALAGSSLGAGLHGPFHRGRGGPGEWWILDGPELHLGDDVPVPDIAGWLRERMPTLPETAWFERAPEWVCEVLSPGTRRLDLTDKRDSYGVNGVAALWLVDPLARTLEAFALEGGRWVLVAALEGEAEESLPPFDAITFQLADLWAD